ncbi:hypothetical protein uan_031 [Pseudomonas phage UAntarctica]|nr:hypothetical protein uan_031 [Pseudomonas phage UAntarctica]
MSQKKIIAETFTCSQAGGVEYGFTFKYEGEEDTLFDVVLGEAKPGSQDVIESDWDKFQWVADAIVKGQP